MLPVWTPVIVTNPDHPRVNTAGTVHRINPTTHPDSVIVKFDTDGNDASGAAIPGSEESMVLTDLRRL